MSKVIFVGDRPSRLNTHYDVAFEGTRSYDELKKWIDFLKIPEYELINSHSEKNLAQISIYAFFENCKIIALGNIASQRLDKLQIPHLKMDHPSPRNRKLNDKLYVQEQLNMCLVWINETV